MANHYNLLDVLATADDIGFLKIKCQVIYRKNENDQQKSSIHLILMDETL